MTTANKFDYEGVIKEHSWILEKEKNCIVSPDSDGLLCGLLMAHHFDWKIVGFYDGKNLLLKEGMSTKDCIFLDMEILRKDIKSLGQHMNIHNFNQLPEDYEERTKCCINPNNLRKFDRAHNFDQKYPLASVHLLLYLLGEKYPNKINVKKEGFGAIFFADGVWKILFKYTDNVLYWLDYFHVNTSPEWWEKLKELSIIDLIREIDSLIKELKKIKGKARIGHVDLEDFEKEKDVLINLLNLFSKLTGWDYNTNNWDIENLKKYKFTKKIYDGSRNNDTFLEIWKNALSLAMTKGNVIQYTLEEPDMLP